jgi:DNA-binding protein WhiA
MHFVDAVREELSKAPRKRACCALAELAAMILASGGLVYRGAGKYGVSIHTESAAAASRGMSLCERFLGVRLTLQSAVSQQLGTHIRYDACADDADADILLEKLHLLDPAGPFGMRTTASNALLEKPCCQSAFLRGAFLGCGTVGDPQKAYQLEFALRDEALARQIFLVLKARGLSAKLGARKSQAIVYLKDGDSIGELFGQMSAFKAVTDIESIRVMKEVRMQINRQVNCDTNNVDRVIDAAEQQLSAIRYIDRRLGLDALEKPLRALARARLAHPDLSLADLGAALDPPLSKSGVNARMRRLKMIAEELV